MLARSFALLALGLTAACGDDGSNPGDGGPMDLLILVDGFDNASCGDTIRLTGEYINWNQSTGFCGINEAVFEVDGGGQMDNTAPNGRFDLCTPDQAATRLVVTQPVDNSQCTQTPAMYTIPTILYARKDVILSGAFYSARSWTTAQQDAIFTNVGQPFDAAKAQVHVHVHGNPDVVSLGSSHGPVQAIATTTAAWAPGATGVDVFFPNVDVGGGQTTLLVAGGAVGTGSIPLVAGTITNVTVHAP